MKKNNRWKKIWENIKVWGMLIIFFGMILMGIVIPKKTICVDTFDMKNISVEDADLKEAGDFLRNCIYACSNYLNDGNSKLECVKLCFSKVQVK